MKHSWVKYTMTPVEVDNEHNISVREPARELAEQAPAYGCAVCNMPVDQSEYPAQDECPGLGNEALLLSMEED